LQHEVVAAYNQFQASDKSSLVAQFPEEHKIKNEINIMESKEQLGNELNCAKQSNSVVSSALLQERDADTCM
jgi:hypothetical protein